MKLTRLFITGVITALVLSGCAANQGTPAGAQQQGEINEAIQAFEDICLETAPSFAGAAQAAASFGILEIKDAGFMKMGSNANRSLGVQIKAENECAVTTPSQPDSQLTRQFLQAVGRHAGAAPRKRVPTKAYVRGVPFMFHHDRQGGEAFVMLKADK
ncbi:hypothetical protein [Diaphorobacter ruginosibacter]|uniref:hypothetical protein n=1 Tax=Diaphorobacter ruginosibacter TaxID=1715720 RepID=UPI0033400033